MRSQKASGFQVGEQDHDAGDEKEGRRVEQSVVDPGENPQFEGFTVARPKPLLVVDHQQEEHQHDADGGAFPESDQKHEQHEETELA